MENAVQPAVERIARRPERECPPIRAGILCDLVEEEWPSMDLVADMLLRSFSRKAAPGVTAFRLVPPMRRRFTAINGLRSAGLARNADRLLNRMVDYPNWLQHCRTKFDIFHIVDHSYSHLALSLPPGKVVVTCHDLDTFRCLLSPEIEKRPVWFRAMSRRILKGLQQAAHIICVSESTRDALIEHKIVPASRTTVIYNGTHPDFRPDPDPDADAKAGKLLGDKRPFLLSVGSTIPRKRIDVLLRLFATMRETYPELRLVRVGGPFTPDQVELAERLSIAHAIRVMPFITTSVLASLYRSAVALVQPSEREGFGLPVIEALACGCKVIASDLPVFREIGGNAITFCPLNENAAWIQAMRAVMQERLIPAELRCLTTLSLVHHARRFSWDSAAARTAEVYRQLL